MDAIQAIVLALVQGVTEFLPISSSGHLILVPIWLGWPDQGLAFDIAVHLGTLAAVLTYFRRELWSIATSLTRHSSPDFRLGWGLVVGSVPLALAGVLFAGVVEARLRTPGVIAAATAGFGVLLWAADVFGRGRRQEAQLSWRDILVIGCGQALALIPGTSRSGITMTVGLALGLTREAAARFSFLLAVPALSMASVWLLAQLASDPEPAPWGSLALGTVVAAITAFLSIAFFLRLIGRIGMGVFAVYRLLLAAVIVYVAL